MAFIEAGFEGDFNGVTAVDVLPAPSAATRRLVRSISVYNTDTVSHTVTLRKSVGGGPTVRDMVKVVLAPGDELQYDRTIVLNNTDEKIVGVLASAITTTNPTFDVAFADAS